MRRPDIVNHIRQAIRQTDPTATAILYGSEARGDARPDSDIDVLVLLEGDQRDLHRESEVSGALYEVEANKANKAQRRTKKEATIPSLLLRNRRQAKALGDCGCAFFSSMYDALFAPSKVRISSLILGEKKKK